MKTLILYYSRSGNTRTVATTLARALAADVEELRCDRYATGFRGYWRAAFDSLRSRLPELCSLTHDIPGYDLVVIAGPVWTSHAATPVRALVARERQRLPRYALLLTLGGAGGAKALGELEAMAGRPAAATLLLTEADIKAGRIDDALNVFAVKLQHRLVA